MANIWPVYEGNEPTYGAPWASVPLADAVALFRLKRSHYIKAHGEAAPFGPRFGDDNRNMRYAGYKHIVVELSPDEIKNTEWKSGYYLSPVEPKEAYRLLLEQAVASELGPKNVVGLRFEPDADAEGQAILKIVIVLSSTAVVKLKGIRIVGALTRLRERLMEMGEDRAPIVQYATKEEVRQLAGH